MQPSWRLISVLFSTTPLTPALSMTLFEAACELFRKDQVSREIGGDLVSGRVRNLRKESVLGSISGPTFEAKVETERGSGTVRFLITRDVLEAEELAPTPKKTKRPKKELLN